MALWVPEGSARGEGQGKRRRVQGSCAAGEEGEGVRRREHSLEVDGPMMALWGI